MKRKVLKTTAVFLAINLMAQIVFPTAVYALGGGPSQPEVQSFEPVGTTEMVDLASGDFVYNIPLLDVEGYPVNLAYHSGITTDQEASWVGLGWNINPGVINRNMRGLPDDFKGGDDANTADRITRDVYMKPDHTIGLNAGMNFELFGLKKIGKTPFNIAQFNLGISLGVFYNNYRGVGYEQSITPSFSAGNKMLTRLQTEASFGLSSNTQSGMDMSQSVGFGVSFSQRCASGMKYDIQEGFGGGVSVSVGRSVNSRSGIVTLTSSKSISQGSFSGSLNTSGLSYSSMAYTPRISMPMTGTSLTFDVKLGPDGSGADISFNFKGYYSGQWIPDEKKQLIKNAYGYLYAQDAVGKDALRDVNRERDGSFSKHNTNLPITTFTHDIYALSGQGISGMFRPHRGDVGHVHDDEVYSNSNGGSGGLEFNAGGYVKFGANAIFNHTSSTSGRWNAGNKLEDGLKFKGKDNQNPFYEPVYFKAAGEKSLVDMDFLPYQKLNEALRPALQNINQNNANSSTGEAKADQLLAGNADEKSAHPSMVVPVKNTWRAKRDPRNTAISYLTVDEKAFCLEKDQINSENITWSTLSNGKKHPAISSTAQIVTRDEGGRKPHHITEISAINPGGARYVYGIAAYNNKQQEITFTNTKDKGICGTGLAEYDPSFIAQKTGEAGDAYDAYYEGTTMPAYAHSYLLTSVLSPDYVDLDHDGPTPNDLGTYTKINYTRTSSAYRWRTPYQQDSAMHNEGLKSDEYDDKASIIYGEKEIWYMSSVESKNYIAFFKTSLREDGLGVNGIHGGRATDANNRSYKLDEIVLYTRADYEKNGTNAVPVKRVHFEYDYSLCPGVPNNTGVAANKFGIAPHGNGEDAINVNSSVGKLTLKRIYFTYGNSNKGKLSAYEFNYATQGTNRNPSYNIKAYDRWGNYKPYTGCSNTSNVFGVTIPNNAEFPYVDQDETKADQYAASWLLDEIKLPSGGVIRVDYESDDYAYVQDRKAMQMYIIKGFSKGGYADEVSQTLFDDLEANNWVHVNIPEGCEDIGTFIESYLPEKSNIHTNERFLYFNCLMHLKHLGDKKEYVRGYVKIEDEGGLENNIKSISNKEYAIKLKSVTSENTNRTSYANHTNPISKASWEHFRNTLPQEVYPNSNVKKNQQPGLLAVQSLFGVFFDLIEYMQGVNDLMLKRGFGKNMVTNSGWVRLKSGTGFKLGGGVRVKKITIADDWNTVPAQGPQPTYGQEYTYTTKEGDQVISSGVATYEPIIGNDENPWREPVFTNRSNAMKPDESVYTETPFGESYFPGATITYSKVTVKNMSRPDVNVTKHATGKVVTEFYTTKDFPTITRMTPTKISKWQPSLIGGLFKLQYKTQVTAVQGYQVELNDMNGKLKSEMLYAENIRNPDELGKLISGKEYIYKTDASNAKHLNNEVKIITKDGRVQSGQNVLLGVESEMVLDSRFNEGKTASYGIAYNTNTIAATFGIPFPTWMILPSYSASTTRFRSATITRLITRYGILDKTIAYVDGAKISTQNTAFDAETGEVLLTQTENEYKDPIYNLTFPAHWGYSMMEQAYKNEGLEFNTVLTLNNTGQIGMDIPFDITDRMKLFDRMFDQWLVTGTDFKAILQYDTDGWRMIEGDGVIAGPVHVKALRSGKNNTASNPIFNITTKKDPIVTGTYQGNPYASVFQITNQHQVLDAKGVEYNAKPNTYCVIGSGAYADRVEFNATDLANVINYLFKSGQVGNNTTETMVTIQNNNCCPVEYNQYLASFIYATGPNYFRYRYQSTATHHRWVFKFYGGINTLTVEFEIPVFTGYYTLPGSLSYNTDNITVVNSLLYGNVYVNVNLNCTPPANSGNGAPFAQQQQDCPKMVAGVLRLSNFTSIDPSPNYKYQNAGDYCLPNVFTSGQQATYHDKFWRPVKNYVYLDNRVPADNTNTNIRKDGYFASFGYLFDLVQSQSPKRWLTIENSPFVSTRWTWTEEITRYTPDGEAIESKDALNRYTSMLHEGNQPIAVANNAERREIAYDGIEYYNSGANVATCPDRHWNFRSNMDITIDQEVSHTGYNSIKLASGQPEAVNSYFIRGCDNMYLDNVPCETCILPFSPYPNKEYVISGWVKVDEPAGNVNNRTAEVRITFGLLPMPQQEIVVTPQGAIIEGWQRFEKKFTIPLHAPSINVKLKRATGKNTWYDDVRIFPVNGNMKSYVYDYKTRRVMAELDENNYATFYEYDEEGALKRVKKETEKGIVTVKEARNNTKH